MQYLFLFFSFTTNNWCSLSKKRIPAEAAPPVPLRGSENKYSEKRSPSTNGDNGWEKHKEKLNYLFTSIKIAHSPVLFPPPSQNRDDVFTISLMLTRKMFF